MHSYLAEPTNKICSEQNSEPQLARLAAQRSLYRSAKRVFAVHALLSTVVAAALAFAAQKWFGLKPYAALWGATLTILDVVWLTPRQKTLRESAAAVQEAFDCDVLELPWQPVKVGTPVDPELVHERAADYRKVEPSFASLLDWYPAAAGRLPLFLARIACQRVNVWWDANQRRRYAFLLVGIVVTLVLGLLVLGVAAGLHVADLVLTVFLPLSSGIVLALRQYKENSDAAHRLDKLKHHARELCAQALAGAGEHELTLAARRLQDEIFEHRKRNVPVFDWLYGLLRPAHEQQVQASTNDLVRELEATQGPVSAPTVTRASPGSKT